MDPIRSTSDMVRLLMRIGIVANAAFLLGTAAYASSITLNPSKDNSLYEIADGSISNGKGQRLFSGVTLEPSRRRALLAFDLSGIPSGSTIVSATLTMNMSLTIAVAEPAALHRVTANWGEGTSDAPGQEGSGALATAGDATWLHTFWPSSFWTTPGGDFDDHESATTTVDQTGSYQWSAPAMVEDVQGWLDAPSTNFGWILITNENDLPSAKRFDSRENATAANRPALTIRYSPPGSAGTVPDGGDAPGTPLTVQLSGGSLILSWGSSCTGSDTDYAIYQGVLSSSPSHMPLFCSTGGLTSAMVTPSSGNRYYLVVPRNATHEGSYGKTSAGLERPVGTSECRPQLLAECP